MTMRYEGSYLRLSRSPTWSIREGGRMPPTVIDICSTEKEDIWRVKNSSFLPRSSG